MSYLDKISDADNLVRAYYLAQKGSNWKESVQRFGIDLLFNVLLLQSRIRNGTYKQLPFFEFDINERGKTRHIKSLHISDRVVQRSTCDNMLVPTLVKYLIYDNGASLKDKGVSFARKRFVKHLSDFYRKYGNNGYVLFIDFSKFFDNVPHAKLIEAFAKRIDDKEAVDFVAKQINSFAVDVSYLTDEEYNNYDDVIFDSLKYKTVDKSKLAGNKFLFRSLGIGSQNSQISGIYYPTPIDTWCKVVRQCKFYGRYMDDIYIIHNDKDFLKSLLFEINTIARDLGLFINHKKTQIVKISKGFTFLQIKYNLTETGKILQRLTPKAFTRERRKLKKYKRLLDNGKMSYSDIEQAYASWRGNAVKFNSYRSIKNTDKLYISLFKK